MARARRFIARRHSQVPASRSSTLPAGISVHLPSNVDINDLINDGVFGLIDAIEKYDDARSVKFETYAITRINGAMLDALRSLDWVPRNVRQRAREVDSRNRGARSRARTRSDRRRAGARLRFRCASSTGCASESAARSVVSLEEPLPNSGDHEL